MEGHHAAWCLTCGYDLHGQTERCPECGRVFDPGDRRTFSSRPMRTRLFRWLKYSLITVLAILLPPAVAYGWLWAGWKSEQKAIADFPGYEVNQPIGGYKLQAMLGSHGYILDRCNDLDFSNHTPTDAEMADVGRLTHLRVLWAMGTTDTGLANVARLHSLEELNLVGAKVTNAGLVHLRGFAELRELYLCRTRVTDLDSLSGLAHLEELSVGDCKIPDSGVAALGRMGSLRSIDLSYTHVTDAGLSALVGLDRLGTLDLSGNAIRGPGLPRLQKLPQLDYLKLDDTDIRDDSLAFLEGFPALALLDLSDNYLTDAAIPHLAKIEKLELLDLSGTFITDRGLQQLKRFPHLKYVTLTRTEVTERGIKELQAELPGLEVTIEDRGGDVLHWDSLLQLAEGGTMPAMAELQLRRNPPVKPLCEQMEMPEGSGPRRYLAVDLNDDGRQEYFVENYFSNDTRIAFDLVDAKGRPLVAANEKHYVGGERVVILNSKHHGYCDFMGYDCDPSRCRGELWQFDGRGYVCVKSFDIGRGYLKKVQIDEIPGTARARWYSAPPVARWDVDRN